MRTHGMTVAEVGMYLSGIVVVGGFIGTYYGGAISDRYYAKKPDPCYYLWVPAVTLIINVPVGLFAYSLSSRVAVLATLIPYIALAAAYLAPSIATTHRLVGLRERSVAGALLLLVLNLIGLGLGPMFTGFLSDTLMAYFVDGGTDVKEATALGLQWAIRLTVLINAWSALHYVLATRTLNEDIALGEREAAAHALGSSAT
jgi:hypothetical protein